jgi:hypothetical protein
VPGVRDADRRLLLRHAGQAAGRWAAGTPPCATPGRRWLSLSETPPPRKGDGRPSYWWLRYRALISTGSISGSPTLPPRIALRQLQAALVHEGAQTGGVVADDAVHAEVHQARHVRGGVHGPRDDGQAELVRFGDHLRGDGREGGGDDVVALGLGGLGEGAVVVVDVDAAELGRRAGLAHLQPRVAAGECHERQLRGDLPGVVQRGPVERLHRSAAGHAPPCRSR